MIKILIQAYEKINKNKYIIYFRFQSTKNPIPCKNDNKLATKKYMHSYTPILLKLKPYDREKNTSKYQINLHEPCFKFNFPL